jgi:hypothetical protein
VLWSGAVLPRPGESLDDYRKRWEAEVRPLQPGEVLNLDGSLTTTTPSTVTLNLRELQMEVEEYPLPDKPPSRWNLFFTINGIGILLLLIIWALWRRGS